MSIFLRNLETTNTKLAAALSAVGIPLHSKTPVRRITGGKGDQVAYFFFSVSPCGQYHTEELMKAWDDEAWHLKNPDHPFAYLRVAFQNMERLRDYINRSVPIASITKGSKIAFISLKASDELQQKVFKELKL